MAEQFCVDAIPTQLKEIPRWLVWRRGKRLDANGRFGKIPYDIADKKARYTDRQNWLPFDRAVLQYMRGNYEGIGIVLGDGLCGLDEDDCVRDGTVDSVARTHIDHLNSYAEYSLSRKGVHCLAFGSLPARGRKQGKHEIYSDRRFFVVTGWRLPGVPNEVAHRKRELYEVHAMIFPGQSFGTGNEVLGQSERVPNPCTNTQRGKKRGIDSWSRSDEDVTNQIARDPVTKRLWSQGHTQGGDESREDLAFCFKLAFYTGKNLDQMERIFRTSPLARREKANRLDYLKRTLQRAYESQNEVWKPAPFPTREAPKRRPGRPPCNVTSQQVGELHELGLSQRKIAEQLGISKSQVNRLLKHYRSLDIGSCPAKASQNSFQALDGGEVAKNTSDVPDARNSGICGSPTRFQSLETVLRDHAIELDAPRVGRLILVADESHAELIQRLGGKRGEVYTASEIQTVNRAPNQLVALEIHRWKQIFDGVISAAPQKFTMTP